MINKQAGNSQNGSSFWKINRIGNESRRPRTFNETLPFTTAVPYRLTRRDVFSNDDVPLHYASSLEVVLYENVAGDVMVDNRHIHVQDKTVVITPPMAVHGGWVTGEAGVIYCLQISLECMAHYIQLDNFLAEAGVSLQSAPLTIPEYDPLREYIEILFNCDDNVFRRNAAILSIIETIARHIPPSAGSMESIPDSKEELKFLISWTHDHYDQKIALEDAAAVVGFSKHYFCKWFKRHTDVNYIQYLKRVRVYNAGIMLLSGKSVYEAGYACGFENVSYFIKCFKEIRGCTPKRFVEATKLHNN